MSDRNNESTKILVVDDEQVLRDLITKILTHHGYTVDVAEDGEEAMKKAGQSKYDLLLLDIIMPRKDGIQVLREIKEVQPDCSVILMTAYARLETAIEGIKLGADNYLLKPFDNLNTVVIDVEKSLEKQRLRRENKRLLTELKLSNEELKTSYEKLMETYSEILYEKCKVEAIMNQLPEGLCVIDRDRKLTNFNRTAEEITDYASQEVVGKDWGEVFHGGDCDLDAIWDQASRSEDTKGSFEISIMNKGENYTIALNLDLRILTGVNGDLMGAIISFRNVTKLQERLTEAQSLVNSLCDEIESLKGRMTT